MSSFNNLHLSVAAKALALGSADVFPSARPRLETGRLVIIEPTLKNAPAIPYLDQLVRKLCNVTPPESGPRAFAFTAATKGDGVTFIGKSVASALARHTSQRVLIVDADALGMRPCATDCPDSDTTASQQGAVYKLRHATSNQKWDARYLRANLDEIGRHFDWVVVDCPPLRESDHALAVAPHTSGMLFVVAADSTKRSDIARARRSIELSSGNLLGFVLNKRTWPVPESLYQRL